MVGVEMVLPMYIQTIRGESAFQLGIDPFSRSHHDGDDRVPVTGRIFDKIRGQAAGCCRFVPAQLRIRCRWSP
ncbi:hypothetical protein ACVFZR_09515 [Lacticaseibacillus paracasei]